MALFSMIAAAGAAVQPLPAATEADMRCLVGMLYAVGKAMEAKDKNGESTLLAAAAYYVGRVDARATGVDYTGHIRRIAMDPGFNRDIGKEVERCTLESGTAMQVAGKAAQAAAQ